MLIADDGIVSGPDDPDRQNAQMANMFASGGGMSADAMAGVASSAKGLVSAAKSGGFKLTEAGVKPMRDAIDSMMDRLDSRLTGVHRLTQKPKLGASDFAGRVATHDVVGAESARLALMRLRAVLQDCDEALARAAGVYKENEETNASTFKGDSGSYDGGGSFKPSGGTYTGGGSFRAV